MGYLDLKEHQEFLWSLPFEYRFRGDEIGDLLSDLKSERTEFDSDGTGNDNADTVLTLIILVERKPDTQLDATIASWGLQSCPRTRCLLYPLPGKVNAQELEVWASSNTRFPGVQVCDDSVLDSEEFLSSRLVSVVRQGDALHPSTAAKLDHILHRNPADIIVWNEVKDVVEFCRRRRVERVAWTNGPSI